MAEKIKIDGIHHVALRVRDFDKSMAFYTELFGCKKHVGWGEKPHRAVMLNAGRGEIVELFERAEQPAAKEAGTMIHFCFRVDDCKVGIEAARSAGWPVVVEMGENKLTTVDGPVKMRYAFFTGPDGEVIELLEIKPRVD